MNPYRENDESFSHLTLSKKVIWRTQSVEEISISKKTSTENNRSYFIDKNIVSTECTTNST